MKKIIYLLFCLPFTLSAQIGGRHVFDFLNVTPSARIAGLGGFNVANRDHDVNFAYQNPGLLTDSMHKQLSLSVVNYLSDITFGYMGYAHHFDKVGTIHGGLQYVNYGKFIQADDYGNITGTYGGTDLAFVGGYARAWKRFDYGVNVKLISSNIGGYNAWGAGFDLGASYHSKDELLCAGLVFKNMGGQISTYTPTGIKEPLPFQIQAGFSYKLKYMPMRFNVTAHNLQTPILIFPSTEQEVDINGNPIAPKKQIGHKIASHFIISPEFILGKNLRMRFGYNHLRRYELRSQNRAGLAGFSLGAGIRISYFTFDYCYAGYNAVGGSHQFSLSTNLNRFKKKS